MDNSEQSTFPHLAGLSDAGLTKREYFAGQAMLGIVTSSNMNPQDAAKLAVQTADALLEELEYGSKR